MKKTSIILLAAAFLSATPAFSAEEAKKKENTEPVPFGKDEFPQWAKDLRRAEIISLGSLPFVTLGTICIYGGILYQCGEVNEFPNPFNGKAANLSEEHQKTIFAISLGAGIAVGVIDFTISMIKRANKKKRLERQKTLEGQILVNPLDETFPVTVTEITSEEKDDSETPEENLPENE